MVSRKRNKGKERKAKKEEKEKADVRSVWERFARGEDKNNTKVMHCNHGYTVDIPDDPSHPVSTFIDSFFAIGGDWWKSLNSHTKVWNDDNYRNLTTDILLNIGANLLLNGNTKDVPLDIASAIVLLDHYKETKSMNEVYLTRSVSAKGRDLRCGNMRDVLKFFSKRTSCSCMKKMYSEARKTLPKVGKCYHCKEVKERALLSVCSKCRVAQYCSRECQVAHWPEHEDPRGFCSEHVRLG